jgi:hypothetical protein
MNDEERGRLLVEKEKAEQKLHYLQRELKQHADVFTEFAQKLRSGPETIVFANAPGNLGSHGPELLNAPAIPWDKVDSIAEVAQKIQDLRAAQKNLMTIQSKLASRF